MKIEVKVEEVSFDSVVSSAYRESEFGGSYDLTLGQAVASILAERFVRDSPGDYQELRAQVLSIRNEVIREKVTPLIEEAISTSFQRTTHYGEPTGPQVTMREIIMDEVKKAFTQPVGNATNYNGSEKLTLVSKLVREAVAAEFTKVIGETVKNVKAEIAAVAADSARSAVILALSKK